MIAKAETQEPQINKEQPTSFRLLTPEQAASILSVAVGTLANWRCKQVEGQPPYHDVMGMIRYRSDELEAWMRKQTEMTSAI